MSFAMNSSLHKPSSSNHPHPLQLDVTYDHDEALELERLHELRRQVAAQERKLHSLRQQAANSDDSHNLLTAEQGVMKSLIFTKEKELALALMKVAELTSQLEQLRRGHVDDTPNKSSQKRIECTGSLAACEAAQFHKGSHNKAIPIRIIKENVRLSNDLRKFSAPQNIEENSKSDRESGVRFIPIVVERKTVGIPIAVVVEGKEQQGTTDVTSRKTVLSQNFNISVPNDDTDASQTTDVCSKTGVSSDIQSTSMSNNLSSNKGAENGVRSLTADLNDIKTEAESEMTAENKAGSLTVLVESSFGIDHGSKTVENDKAIPLQSSEDNRVADSLSDNRNVHDGKNSIHIDEDSNCTGNLFRDLSKHKTADVTDSSSFDKTENGFSVFADDEHDVSQTKAVVSETVNDSNIGNFSSEDLSSEETNGSTLKGFSQSKKSFSDFSLSTQLGQPLRESFSSRSQAGQTTRLWDSVSILTKQSQPSADVGKSAIKNDRARFFMDMVREDDTSVVSSPPLLDSVRCRGLVDVKPSTSPAVSTTTSRGRSSSSAIMSRFAPQPYGRSKSVDSASLRVPMLTVFHGTLCRDQSPDVMGVDSRTGSSSTITPSSEPSPPSVSSLTISSQLQTVTSSPVETMVTKATEDKQEIAALSLMHVPDKEVTLSKTGIAAFTAFDEKPSYAIPTVSPSLGFSEKKIFSAASLEKSLPDSRHFVSKPSTLGKAAGDSDSSTIKTPTAVVADAALSQIDPLFMAPCQTESDVDSARDTATGRTLSPTSSSYLTLSPVCGAVPFGSVPQAATTASGVSCSLRTQDAGSPLVELEFSKAKLSAGSDMTAVVNCTKSLSSVKASPGLSTNSCMLSDSKISPFTRSTPVSARGALKEDSLSSESSAERFRTVSDLIRSSSPSVSALANSESTTEQISVGAIPKSLPTSVSKAEEVQCAEEMADTPWDSNVKRLAQIFAVTIGGTVKNKVNFRGSKSKASDYAAGTNNSAPSNDVSNQDVLSASANRTEHSKKAMHDVKSSVTSSANVSTSISDMSRSSPSSSRTAVSPCVQHRQIPVDPSHSMNCLPSHTSPDITQTPHHKVNSLEQSKIDTSADSVSTALSVLLRNNSSGHSSPVRPSRLRTTISSAYRRKLGSGALDNYSQNMTLLYGDCTPKKDDNAGPDDVQDSSTESIVSPPLLEAPLIEDLPRILALDTLDGMPFYPRIGSHAICCENEISGDGTIDGKTANDQLDDNCNESSLTIGDVELTVIPNPVQVADLVQLDSVETSVPTTLASFSPSDDLVSSYIDDPVTSDRDRFVSETPARPFGRRMFRKDGKPQRRVTFDPVSLLLNAALEGEKDVVIDVVNKISNPNHKTENGLSALHNAVCSGHLNIVRYLVAFGCDVNAIDNDGWTPLHCAASSNNVELMRILVENGASVLPMTISDRETPVQKCSRNLPGCEEAVQYLTDVARNLGVEKDGWVCATSNFANVCSDELVLHDGDRLKVLRRGDESETEWWWAKDEKNAEGYVPQSLLALFPRIQPKWLK